MRGGLSFFRWETTEWSPLHHVHRVERDFTQQQRTVLKQDSQRARGLLDRVISRLGGAAEIWSAAMVLDMQRKVRNIFHINVIDPDLAALPTEAFAFAELLSRFKFLRTSGFDQDPLFLFEPDYVGSLTAWVIGVDDPIVHISPNHFFMDRDGQVITLVHERAHTVLRLQGHPGGVHVIADPAEGVPTMTREDAKRNAYCYEWLASALR